MKHDGKKHPLAEQQHILEPSVNEPVLLLLLSQVEEGQPELVREAQVSNPSPPAQILPLKGQPGTSWFSVLGPGLPSLLMRHMLLVLLLCLASGS